MKQRRDAKGRFLSKESSQVINTFCDQLHALTAKPRVYTEQDILNAFKAGIADSGKGFLLPSKKAELYLRNLKWKKLIQS